MLSGGLSMQTSTVSESIPITILTPELHLGQKQSQTNISILWAKSGCKAKHKWRIGKDSKIGAIKTNSYLPSVDFTLFDAIGTVFSEDDGSWDKGMVKVYDNFANDFLYPNINNIMVLPKIMIRIASMKSIRMILENTR
jgi:hypothetical protein